MNKLFFLALAITTLFLATSCIENKEVEYEYHALVNSPNSEDKHVNDSIHIHVDLESHTGQTIHHINVRIYNKTDNTEVYNKPKSAHIHAEEGTHSFHDDFVLTNDNGVAAHTDWILEAKIWGHEAEEGEVIEIVEFHVHPE